VILRVQLFAFQSVTLEKNLKYKIFSIFYFSFELYRYFLIS